MTGAIPIILAGKSELVAEEAIGDMRPELDVVHFTFINDARREIPILSRGEIPSPRNPHGTGDWSNPPKVIVFVAAYHDRDINTYRQLTGDASGENDKKLLPWLRVDRSIPAPPIGPELVRTLCARAKAKLAELNKEGKLVPGGSVDYYY
ncbi:hypothetical protein CMQ_2715 [Grosmannia clavigera kw1407]|uniref:Uncharacterized protein n=1 Tax=Grosmannia clavigera (strain kw1407 / UAMH 11150) TaxID=655863 RepID=F0XGJ1_GROCL|nr:uncharacterized protein CMQ_2715 [Grosmannia clavigera kw1407]EFX02786.1 hypothetical protein CMQ_2715 [Grosmannia clavigera kw1407]